MKNNKAPRKRRLDIEEMRAIAEKHGGRCLSGTYINGRSKLLWECAKNHRWEAEGGSVKQGHWCRKCAADKRADGYRLGMKEMHTLAEKRGGKCLSSKYINAHSKLLWECAQGHRWEAEPCSIQAGKWCRQCWANRLKQAYRKRVGKD